MTETIVSEYEVMSVAEADTLEVFGAGVYLIRFLAGQKFICMIVNMKDELEFPGGTFDSTVDSCPRDNAERELFEEASISTVIPNDAVAIVQTFNGGIFDQKKSVSYVFTMSSFNESKHKFIQNRETKRVVWVNLVHLKIRVGRFQSSRFVGICNKMIVNERGEPLRMKKNTYFNFLRVLPYVC